jgi:hypothetical protein
MKLKDLKMDYWQEVINLKNNGKKEANFIEYN